MTHQFYSTRDAEMLAVRRHMRDLATLTGETDKFFLRGRSEYGRGFRELHLDFETTKHSFWIAIDSELKVTIRRHDKSVHNREKFQMSGPVEWKRFMAIVSPEYVCN